VSIDIHKVSVDVYNVSVDAPSVSADVLSMSKGGAGSKAGVDLYIQGVSYEEDMAISGVCFVCGARAVRAGCG
jgi:hypothetical protein